MYTQKQNKHKLTVREITLIGMMIAIIEVCKVLMMHIPNIELTTFWIIMFTAYFGNRMLYVIPAFIILEGTIFGFGMWWIMYLYLWPLLAFVTWMFRKEDSVWIWATIAGVFGLLFGFFGAIPYIVTTGIYGAFSWWIAGIPWDIVHGIGNFLIMLVLYYPLKRVMNKVNHILVV